MLPQEVLAVIIDSGSFSRHELSTMSLVSPHFRHETQRRLFRDPGPHTINVRFGAESLNTTRMFLEAIASSADRLALMVRRYHITPSCFDFHVRFGSEQRALQQTLLDQLARGLPLMVNLKELCYHERLAPAAMPDSVPPPPIWPVFSRYSFKLQVFRCSYIGTKNREALAAFLRSQDGIRELWLDEPLKSKAADTVVSLKTIFKDVCPSLVSLGGMTEIVVSMLEGRQGLKHIAWEENDSLTMFEYNSELFDSTDTSSVELMQSLRCGPTLSLICDLFKNLVVLKTRERVIIQKFDILTALQRLRVLIVDLEGGFGITSDLDDKEGVIRQAFSDLVSLDYLECHQYYDVKLVRKYVINRVTQVVEVYTIPWDIALSNSEGMDGLLSKVLIHVDSDHTFEKSFTMN